MRNDYKQIAPKNPKTPKPQNPKTPKPQILERIMMEMPDLSKIDAQPMDEEEAVHDCLLKVIIIGDQAVGKSCILGAITGKKFEDNIYDATVGVEFGNYIVNVNSKVCKLQIWDTAGTECF